MEKYTMFMDWKTQYSEVFIDELSNIKKMFNKKKVLVPVTNKKRVKNKGLEKDLA